MVSTRSIPRAPAFIRHLSSASATTASSLTGTGSGTGSAAWILDRVIRSFTRLVSLDASYRMRPAKRRTASGSSAASSTVSASRARAPTGVLSSWLTLATKSRLTSSTRRLSVWSSASTSTSPPPARRAERGDANGEAGGAVAVLVIGDLDLALADLAVPANLPGQGEQLADEQLIPLDEPERTRRRARAQDPVLAVEDHGGGRKHGENRRYPGG